MDGSALRRRYVAAVPALTCQEQGSHDRGARLLRARRAVPGAPAAPGTQRAGTSLQDHRRRCCRALRHCLLPRALGRQAWGGLLGRRVDAAGDLEVRSCPLPEIMEEAGLDRISLLHMDIQGGEANVAAQCRERVVDGRLDNLYVGTHEQSRHDLVKELLTPHIELRIDALRTVSRRRPSVTSRPWMAFSSSRGRWILRRHRSGRPRRPVTAHQLRHLGRRVPREGRRATDTALTDASVKSPTSSPTAKRTARSPPSSTSARNHRNPPHQALRQARRHHPRRHDRRRPRPSHPRPSDATAPLNPAHDDAPATGPLKGTREDDARA
jgi:hypothetical protein